MTSTTVIPTASLPAADFVPERGTRLRRRAAGTAGGVRVPPGARRAGIDGRCPAAVRCELVKFGGFRSVLWRLPS